MDRRPSITRVTLGLLLLVTALVYSPLRTAWFVYEDDHGITGATTWTMPGRGLTQWAYGVLGTQAPAQHAVNVGLHLTVGVLVYAVAAVIATPLAGVLAATMLLLHPLSSEAVSYLSARGDLFVALFTLLVVWAVLTWTDRRGAWRLAVAGMALLGAALSKEIGLVAIPLVVLTLLVFRRGLPQTGWLTSALWGGLGVVAGATWWRVSTWIVTAHGDGGAVFDWPTFVTLQLTAVWHLLALIVWPAGFSIDHDIIGLAFAWRIAAAALTASVAVLGVWAWRRAPLVAWVIGWVALCVAPRVVFASTEFVHEYHLYPAMTAVSIGIGVLAARWCARWAGDGSTHVFQRVFA